MTKITILDGGIGRELSARGAPFKQPEWSALALWEAPEQVQLIHEDFIGAGAEVITTNSYALVPFHIGEARFTQEGEQLTRLSAELAQNAVRQSGSNHVKVAGCLPPLFGSYRPDLFSLAEAKRIAMPLINGLADNVDYWLLETQSSLIEAQTVLDLLPHDNKPVWVSFTLTDETTGNKPTIRSGEHVGAVVRQIAESNVSAILFNCSNPEVMNTAISVARKVLEQQSANIQLGVYANAFSPQLRQINANEGLSDIRTDLNAEEYLTYTKQWVQSGATIIGGCCGIGPTHIARLAQHFHN